MWLGSDRLKKATAITSGVLLKKLFNMLNNDKHRNKGFAKEAIIGGQNPADQSVQLLQLRSTSAGGSSDGTSGFGPQAAGGEQSEGRVERPRG